ncbi:ubiquitin carboxyl-terminal hydrolase 10 isoform X2 [Macrosteles quadrilineatus]|uniref:ubiquitin carboxyl-terminal hydrolase 10 isoform X2 n=1 Tax=Macrosteles quadrilineatus TaxID=74068 RepID=UPI0023E34D82|nr:ubiquitin carboxyl-terminal hydrolase 10 isoform X2 [Macrosteles quadrilineatus]
MDKLQFLDLTDLNPNDEEQLNSILFSCECPGAVELPPEAPPAWVQHPVPYQSDPVNGGEGLGEVDYSAGSAMMAPHTVQYTQMMPPPSVYVSNVTANVNVHGFVPQTVAYQQVPFMQPVEPQPRKARPAKISPTKRSPEAASYTPPFTPPFHPTMFPPVYYPLQLMTRPVGIPPVYPTAPQVFGAAATFPQPMFPHHVQQPPTDNPAPFVEEEKEEEEPQEIKEEQEDQPEEEISEQPTVEETAPPAVEVKAEEIKVEKPLATKAPPVNAFKSAPSLTQKPPFPQPASKPKRTSVDGPEFVDPPVETGPPKKSFASLFVTGDRAQTQSSQAEASAPKPLAMIHPTVHNSVTNSPRPEKFNSTPPAQVNNTTFSNTMKVRPEKAMPVQKDMDYDINLQRLGEFLSEYQLDHKPLQLQPRGLTNRSNYCYINAILQALIGCPPFYNLMKTVPPSQENSSGKSRTPVIDSMVKFVNEFSPMSLNTRPVGRREKIQANKEGGAAEVVTGPAFEPVYVYKMLSAMHAAFPVEGRQEDAEEFLSCLLNGLNDEMLEAMKLVEPQSNGLTNGDVTTNGDSTSTSNGNHDLEQDHEWTEVVNKNNKSVITRRAEFGKTPLSAIFRGQMRSRVFRAGVENGTTDNIQPFFTLQLDVEKANSVEKALEQLVCKDEVVGGVCPKTSQEISMYTQTSLEELPLILLLHLKCFDYKLHTCSKIIKTVEFPVDLKIDNKLCTSKSKTPSKDRQYKLLAVVYHDGKEATKGHYITDVFHTGYSSWVRYDDATVRPVTQQQVLNPRPPRVPYLLYYRRCDTINR